MNQHTNSPSTTGIAVAGISVTGRRIPKWVALLRTAATLGIFFSLVLSGLALLGWDWLGQGLSSGFALKVALVMALATGAVLGLRATGVLSRLLRIRGNQWFGLHGVVQPTVALLAATVPLCATGLLGQRIVESFPLPKQLARVEVSVTPARPDELLPIYFWDYATWVDPAWLEQVNLLLPYEKGPPQKLLSKVYLEDATSRSVVLELHGRRPRAYEPAVIQEVFGSAVLHPRDWPLVWQLAREAGLIDKKRYTRTSIQNLSLITIRNPQPTLAIGLPWSTTAEAEAGLTGRLFFWGPDGSVFQVKCPAPCKLNRMLELIQFPGDPKGSRAKRLEWTKTQLRRLLSQRPPASAAPLERRRHENLLSLYLVSMLTLDPRDPEAFFHLGKLARNGETLYSAIRYGRDLGLESAKIAELESSAVHVSTQN